MSQERPTIHLVPHFHYDPVWIEDQRTYTRWAFDLVLQYLEACRQEPGYHVILSEVDYLRPFLAVYGEHRQFVRDLISAGRVATGGAYNEPNETSLQGEAIIRNLLYGRLYHERMLGAKPTVYMPLDVFGHCPQLPQIAAKSGFQAILWSKWILGAPPLSFVIAPDGTALLQQHVSYWYRPETLEQFLDTATGGLDHQLPLGLNQDLVLLGGDMTPPAPWLTGRSTELAERDPAIVLSTPEKYLAVVSPLAHLRSAVVPSIGQDFSWYHLGTPVSRAELKIGNRLAENRLFSAERWATLAALLGARYPDLALDKAWRQVLFGQHHDAITGTSSDIAFLDLLAGYRESLELAAEVEANALHYLAHRVDSASGKRAPREGAALVVFNPLGWQHTDVCRARVELHGPLASGFRLADEEGREIPCQLLAKSEEDGRPCVEIAFLAQEVPSIGYRVYYLVPGDELPPMPSPTEPADAAIENEHLSLRADPARGGGLVSLYDKRLREELLSPERGPANEVVALGERPDREWAPWEVFTTGAVVRSGERQARVSVLQGPVFSQLRVESELPDRCGILQEITLYRGLPRVDLLTTLQQYRGEHELFALSFPLAIQGGVPTFEDRFAAMVRRPSQGRFDFRTREQYNLSGCGISSAQHWVEVGPAPSLKVTSAGGRKGALPLGPCAIITSPELRERVAVRVLERKLLSRGVSCTHWVDAEVAEKEITASAIGWALHISFGRGNSYSRRLLENAPEAAGRLTQALGERAWGAVLVRAPDLSDPERGIPVLIVDTLQPEGLPWLAEALAVELASGLLEIPADCDFSGMARVTDDHGLALINCGSLAASLENDGTLVGFLFHTSSWDMRAWGEGKLDRYFIPEHRSHVFAHALYPHQGDWRDGGVVHAGYEVNNPLRAVQVALQRGALPREFSLISTDSENVVITAVKPLGNPLAEHRAGEQSDPAQGIVVRLYESEGRPENEVELQFAAPPQEAWRADLMERKVGEVQITPARRRQPARLALPLGACEIATVVTRLDAFEGRGEPAELGAVSEPYQPIHCRYWDHNLGAAPMGNQPLTIWLRGEIPIGRNTRFSLGLSNDTLDQEISGVVQVLAPPQWTLIPKQVPYRIAPGSQAVYEIMVEVPADASPCFLRAVTQYGDQVLQDVIPMGDIAPLQVSLAREGQRFAVDIRNPNPDYLEPQLALITPLESWGSLAERFALSAVAPRMHPFRLEAGEERGFNFEVVGDMRSVWAVGKVVWYGRVQYVQEAA